MKRYVLDIWLIDWYQYNTYVAVTAATVTGVMAWKNT